MGDDLRAKLAEVARRYARRSRRPSLAVLRVSELNRLFRARHGEELPDNPAGRSAFEIMAHHLAMLPNPSERIKQWALLRAPWIKARDLERTIEQATTTPRRWSADRLGWRLKLTERDRWALNIRTIGTYDVTKADRQAQRRIKRRLADQQRRRSKGAITRAQYEAQSISRTKPWLALGISRRTYYRRAQSGTVAQVRGQ